MAAQKQHGLDISRIMKIKENEVIPFVLFMFLLKTPDLGQTYG
jgi:hypothetical protein